MTSIKERYIAQRFELNGGVESTVDVNNLSEEFMKSRLDYAAWYDAKYEETQDLIDEIHDRTSFIIDEDEYDAFLEELASYGITESRIFQDAFHGEFEGVNQEEQFAAEFIDEMGYRVDLPAFIGNHLDYKMIWECEFKHDYFIIEFKGNSYFFNRNY